MNSAVPRTTEEAVARLRGTPIPAEILEVARRLQGAGHEAHLVGGGVRDALLGLHPDDWDLATSATPDEVQGSFRRTVPTGIEHGTVTVLVRAAADRRGKTKPVEVTTFRGEGEYADGRRPSSVQFLRDLHEDLARRDFTVNALAWDPLAEIFTDPFGGLDDLAQGRIRAVGDPRARFAEDGLRTMRAVRFCATRSLALDPATRDAIPAALSVLDKVSRERVAVELVKLLGAPKPSLGLMPMRETGMWPHVLPDLPPEAWPSALTEVDDLPADPVLRLARLLRPQVVASGGDPRGCVEAFERLRPSRHDRNRLAALLGPAAGRLGESSEPVAIRRAAAALGREHVEDALRVWGRGSRTEEVRAAIEGVPLAVRDLPLGGRDLMAAGLASAGPGLGELLDALLDAVWSDPTLADRDRLLDRARALGANRAD